MPETPEDDLSTLFSSRQVTVAGRELTVRELSFEQSMAINACMQPVIDALVPHYGPAGDGVDSDLAVTTLNAHPDAAIELMHLSTGQPRPWLAGLPEHIGTPLLMRVVEVNIHFFASRLELRHQARQRIAAPTPTKAPARSSRGSSATGTRQAH